jgi:hypothetical protein
VPTPAAVKEGEVAPYQELVLLTAPTQEEDRWIERERERFAALQSELLVDRCGTLPLADWLQERLGDRRAADDSPLPWREVEAAEPDLARAALRLASTGAVAVPGGARLREEHRAAPDSRDWAALLQAYAHDTLVPSRELADERLLRTIREVLPSLGWQLTIRGLRSRDQHGRPHLRAVGGQARRSGRHPRRRAGRPRRGPARARALRRRAPACRCRLLAATARARPVDRRARPAPPGSRSPCWPPRSWATRCGR